MRCFFWNVLDSLSTFLWEYKKSVIFLIEKFPKVENFTNNMCNKMYVMATWVNFCDTFISCYVWCKNISLVSSEMGWGWDVCACVGAYGMQVVVLSQKCYTWTLPLNIHSCIHSVDLELKGKYINSYYINPTCTLTFYNNKNWNFCIQVRDNLLKYMFTCCQSQSKSCTHFDTIHLNLDTADILVHLTSLLCTSSSKECVWGWTTCIIQQCTIRIDWNFG